MPAGFVSKAQWRWAYSTHKSWAHKEAHKVEARGGEKTGYRALPTRTGVRRNPR